MKQLKTPPNTLLFNLVAVQQFPKNQKVALYFCKDLKKYFSLNYGKEGIELSESDFSIINKLKNISDIEPLYFHDGSTLNINEECATNILKIYESLSEGKSEFEDYILSSDKNFLKLLDYSINKFQKED